MTDHCDPHCPDDRATLYGGAHLQAEHRFTPDLLGALDQVIAARQAEHRRLAAERAALRGEGA